MSSSHGASRRLRRLPRGSAPLTLLSGLLAVAFAFGCGGRKQDAADGPVSECASDSDCADGRVCVIVNGGGKSFRTLPLPLCYGTGGQACASSTDCAPGAVCRTVSSFGCPARTECVADCAAAGANPCPTGTTCSPSGLCTELRCDQPSHPGCPTGMACDPSYRRDSNPQEPPGRYSLFGTDQYPEFAVKDMGAVLSERQDHAVNAGCVFLRCNESGSFDCAKGYRCDVTHAAPSSSGCLPIACGEWGACSSDQFVCEPTSSQARPALTDPHGCVSRNCEEGRACPALSVCDFSRPGDAAGCGYLRCDEPGGGCPNADLKCEPNPQPLPSGMMPGVDVHGCSLRRCDLDGLICPAGMICAPDDPAAALTGCSKQPPDIVVAQGGSGSGGASSDASAGNGPGSAGTEPSTQVQCQSDAECPNEQCVNGRCSAIVGECR